MDGDSHTPTFMPNTFRRVEVITGVGRRRRWSVEEKMRIVAESYERSTTVSEVARRHGLNSNQLFSWRHQLRQAADTRQVDGGTAPGFVPLVMEPDATIAAGTGVALPGVFSPVIEIVAGDLTVRVPPGVGEAALRQVLCVVRSLT